MAATPPATACHYVHGGKADTVTDVQTRLDRGGKKIPCTGFDYADGFHTFRHRIQMLRNSRSPLCEHDNVLVAERRYQLEDTTTAPMAVPPTSSSTSP